MNKSSVRRALTTLKKNKVISTTSIMDGLVYVQVVVDPELIQPKKKVYIKKTKKTKPCNK